MWTLIIITFVVASGSGAGTSTSTTQLQFKTEQSCQKATTLFPGSGTGPGNSGWKILAICVQSGK
jgi:hypothetical protein